MATLTVPKNQSGHNGLTPDFKTVTLSYKSHDKAAERTLDYILSMGFFQIMPAKSKFEISMEEYHAGKTIRIQNPENIIEKCLN